MCSWLSGVQNVTLRGRSTLRLMRLVPAHDGVEREVSVGPLLLSDRAQDAARARKYRRSDTYRQNQKQLKDARNEERKAKGLTKEKTRLTSDLRNERTRFLNAMVKKYGSNNVERGSVEFRGGYWYLTVRTKDDRGRWIFKEVRGKSTIR